jgi:hypothetical protein
MRNEGDAGCIVDANVDELPADATMAIDRARIATGDADAAKLLDIDVDTDPPL